MSNGDKHSLLNGWKQIARHLGRGESTVKRWAQEKGLPVYRVPGQKRAVVHAYAEELDSWLRGRVVDEGAPETAPETPPEAAPVPGVSADFARSGFLPAIPIPHGVPAHRPVLRSARIAIAGGLAIVIAALAMWFWDPARPVPPLLPRGDAERLYLEGLYHLEQRNAEGFSRAVTLFRDAATADPDFAGAQIGLANAYNLWPQYDATHAARSYDLASEAAERALALAPRSAEALAALAFNRFYGQRDLTGALALFARAISADPANARAHHWYALVAMHDRRFDTALREIIEAQRLEPTSTAILANKGLILFHAGHVQDALAILEPLAASRPEQLAPAAYLATIYLATGRNEQFLVSAARAARIKGNSDEATVIAAAQAGFLQGGQRGMLEAMLSEQQRLHAAGRMPAFRVALTAAMLGRREQALELLGSSLARHEPALIGLRLEPALRPLHGEPAFAAIVRTVGLSAD